VMLHQTKVQFDLFHVHVSSSSCGALNGVTVGEFEVMWKEAVVS
jgi:hypothetical protein